MVETKLLERKKNLEKRVEMHGIHRYPINHLPYLEFDDSKFATPYEAGSRMIVCYAVSYAAQVAEDREAVAEWLKRENLWEIVSPKERELLEGNEIGEGDLAALSWEVEGAYILAWTLNLVKEKPNPSGQISEEQFDAFSKNVLSLGDGLGDFLDNLIFRDKEEIYNENLFNELATTYFRDTFYKGNEDTSDIDTNASFERHKTLNWLRRFMGIEEWDETDTAT